MDVDVNQARMATLLRENADKVITDGLVADRSALLDENMETLRLASQEAGTDDLEAFCNFLMERFGPREDVVAMIALRWDGPA